MRFDTATRSRVAVFLWTVAGLIAIDVAVNVFFRLPADPRIEPNGVERYFNYGRSTEGKLRYLLGPNADASSSIVARGWLDPARLVSEPTDRDPGTRLLVAFYGMSHARRLGRAVRRVARDVGVRDVTAPGATANWTFSAYQMDRGAHEADAVVFCISAYSVAMLSNVSALTEYFDQAFPYAHPRYRLDRFGRVLEELPPYFRTAAEFRQAFANSARWSAFREFLDQNDPYYDPLLFQESILDRSAIVRALRRSYANQLRRRMSATVYDPQTGFRNDGDEIQMLRAMIADFARTARGDGVVPVVFVVNDLGFGDALYRAVLPVLTEQSVLTLSSHDFVDPHNPRGYDENAHFYDESDDTMARALIELIDGEESVTEHPKAATEERLKPGHSGGEG